MLFPPQEWFTVYEHNRRTNCTASDLIMGNEYIFRVYSENLCGLSDEPCQGKNTAKIAKTGLGMCHLFTSLRKLTLIVSFLFIVWLCFPTLLYRSGAKREPVQGEGHVLCAKVYPALGGQICGGGLQHRHQLRRQRFPKGEHVHIFRGPGREIFSRKGCLSSCANRG